MVHLRDELLQLRVALEPERGWWCSPTPPATIVAIEPVSHVNNAASLVHAGADAAALGLVTLQPGESHHAPR